MFAPYLDRWNLIPDGDPIVTATSHLLPVLVQAGDALLLARTTGCGSLASWAWDDRDSARNSYPPIWHGI
ncbi:hypothetical protein BJI49_13020 [Acetobacter pasteurianus]|nr:hypothetical protein BJI49_13020 [Acetobacter pasteurianus]